MAKIVVTLIIFLQILLFESNKRRMPTQLMDRVNTAYYHLKLIKDETNNNLLGH